MKASDNSVHEISTGNVVEGKIERPFWAGDAVYVKEKDYFKFRFGVFPFWYFLSKNEGSTDQYTIWAQAKEDENTTTFRRPIGRGRICPWMKTHIELQMKFINFGFTPYLSLFPKM